MPLRMGEVTHHRHAGVQKHGGTKIIHEKEEREQGRLQRENTCMCWQEKRQTPMQRKERAVCVCVAEVPLLGKGVQVQKVWEKGRESR